MNERNLLRAKLDTFEVLIERLSMGDPVPNADLARSIEALRECADTEDPNRYTPPMNPASRRLRDMYWALESLERGESGAPGQFVRNAREYLRLVRHRLRDFGSFETVR